MTKSKKAFIKKLISWSGLFFFALAAFMIYHQLSRYTLSEIKDAILSVPRKNILWACLASFCGYVALSSYDFLALKYIGKKLAAWRWIFAGFVGFSVSNNAGHAIVSGGAIRFRLYSRWRVSASDIVKMVTFSGFTYLVACFFLIIIGFGCSPHHLGSESSGYLVNWILVFFSVIGLMFYLWGSAYYKKPIIIKEVEFTPPGIKLALAQVIIGSIDILMASLVLYSILVHFMDIPFITFIGTFIIAQVLGVYSQVPGGLGVFEVMFSNLLPDDDANKATIFAILVLYRIIYYLLPLVISGIALFFYEFGLAMRRKRIRNNKQVL
mgnify:CR=1 FL=1